MINLVRGMRVSTSTSSLADESPNPSKNRIVGTLYRGNEGMWSWVLHRITGIAIYFFLLVHILDTAVVRVSPEVYNAVIGAYKHPIMGLGEIVLVGAVVLHALNGIRVILVDLFPAATRVQRQLFWGVIGLSLILIIGFSIRHIPNVFGAH